MIHRGRAYIMLIFTLVMYVVRAASPVFVLCTTEEALRNAFDYVVSVYLSHALQSTSIELHEVL